MRRRRASLEEQDHSAARFAWWVSFFVTLALVAIFALAHSAQAATATDPLLPPLIELDPEEDPAEEGEEEGGEEAEFDEECDFAEEEGEEVEECVELEADEGAPAECTLTSAEATVAALPARSSVKLVIHYTSRSPAAVSVDLSARGSRGPLGLDGDRGRFGRSGVFRSSERLTEAQMKRVLAARSFTVTVHAVNAPRYCHRYLDRHLTARRHAGPGLVWSDPAAKLR